MNAVKINGMVRTNGQERSKPETVSDGIDWTFDGTWPFEPRWFQSTDGWMHYVDEDSVDAPAVVLVHGNPTWGYLYRNFIPHLVNAGFRVVVPDHLGFGSSDKPDNTELYRIPKHAARLEALLESLDVNRVTVVPQDWGGPTGLYWAGRHPERIARLFILNTWAQRTLETYRPPIALRMFRTPGLGELMVKGLHIFVRGFLFGQGVQKRDRFTPTVRRAYLAPHRSWSSRTSILVFPREIPVRPNGRLTSYFESVEAKL